MQAERSVWQACAETAPHASRPRPRGGGYPARLLPRHERLLQAQVRRRKDATLEELRARLEEQAGLAVSASTVSRALSRLDLPRKKKS